MADQPCGFLVLDKPAGLSSQACVGHVRRAYGLRRVGHGGTLDPAVTGVLPIAVGNATRLLPYLPGEKAYQGVVQLGVITSSDDLEGEVMQRQAVPALDLGHIATTLNGFRGAILQVPPQVSAVHVDGQRAYKRVRRGEILQLQPRSVVIHRLELLGWEPCSGRIKLAVHCSAGTYIRALARDLGAVLGCGGCLASLRRTAALGFKDDESIPLETLNPAKTPPTLLSPLAPLRHLAQHQLSSVDLAGWRCGRTIDCSSHLTIGEPVVILEPDGNLAGMARVTEANQLQPKLVINAAG
jgi:tRNA pseudouridine55 synthase